MSLRLPVRDNYTNQIPPCGRWRTEFSFVLVHCSDLPKKGVSNTKPNPFQDRFRQFVFEDCQICRTPFKSTPLFFAPNPAPVLGFQFMKFVLTGHYCKGIDHESIEDYIF